MSTTLREGDEGAEVQELQQMLHEWGYELEVNGIFTVETYGVVRAFQAQHLDAHGNPLVIDGMVGPLTWWSLRNPASAVASSGFDPLVPPGPDARGSRIGRLALDAAIGEVADNAREVGGNNRGPWVRKYLKAVDPAMSKLQEGDPWCAAFVTWCFLQACGGDQARMPFAPSAAARALLRQFTKNNWAHQPERGYQPGVGDLVFWWRVSAQGWQGHIGLVHHAQDGMLYTIEGNKGPRVQGYSYVLSRMEQVLGFGTVPDHP